MSALGAMTGRYGVFRAVAAIDKMPGDPFTTGYGVDVGYPSRLQPGPIARTAGEAFPAWHCSTGVAAEASHARLIAFAEGHERYAASILAPTAAFWATARELGVDAVDLSRLPRLSASEYDLPGQWLVPPDPDAPIRWVRGWSLTHGRMVCVPAVIASMGISPEHRGERIWLGVCNGFSVHSDVIAAVAGGICECVERDALTVAWLRRLPLPRVPLDEVSMEEVSAEVEDLIGSFRRSLLPLPLAFDATTELGIPTYYLVSDAPHSEHAATVVSCAASLSPRRAIAKALREAITVRRFFDHEWEVPADPTDFNSVHHGASWAARPENGGIFGFLRTSRRRTTLGARSDLATGDPQGDLELLISRLDQHGMEVIVVEVTTDEARAAGLRAVRVFIPELVPISFVHKSRFLGHPRVGDAGPRLGYAEALATANPDPQPLCLSGVSCSPASRCSSATSSAPPSHGVSAAR